MISERMAIRGHSTRHAPIRRVALTLFRFAIGAGLLVYLAKSGIVDFRQPNRHQRVVYKQERDRGESDAPSGEQLDSARGSSGLKD
jgi:hypothetical protein